jgi:hypothetical protein
MQRILKELRVWKQFLTLNLCNVWDERPQLVQGLRHPDPALPLQHDRLGPVLPLPCPQHVAGGELWNALLLSRRRWRPSSSAAAIRGHTNWWWWIIIRRAAFALPNCLAGKLHGVPCPLAAVEAHRRGGEPAATAAVAEVDEARAGHDELLRVSGAPAGDCGTVLRATPQLVAAQMARETCSAAFALSACECERDRIPSALPDSHHCERKRLDYVLIFLVMFELYYSKY